MNNDQYYIDRLEKYMKVKNITANEVADVLGIRRENISRWKNGTASISPKNRKAIAVITAEISETSDCPYVSQCPLSGDSRVAEENRKLLDFLQSSQGATARYEILMHLAEREHKVKEQQNNGYKINKAADGRAPYGSDS